MALIHINTGGTWQAYWGKKPVTTACSCASGCTKGCTGCTGCSGTCQTTCTVGCTGNCANTCTAECIDTCASNDRMINGGSIITCGSSCTFGCKYSCDNGCYGGCQGCTASGKGTVQSNGTTTTNQSIGNFKVNVSGTWKVPKTPKLKVNSSWKSISK